MHLTLNHFRLAATAVAATTLAACGGTTNIQDEAGAETVLDLSNYETVVVGGFSDQSTENRKFKDNEAGQEKRREYQSQVKAGSDLFATYLGEAIETTGAFTQVRRGDSAGPNELFLDGDITRFARGNAVAKFLVGMGAGSTYFDAIVRVHDGANDEAMGQIVVDKNSWALGGAISAAQNIESFMRGGAEKTAGQLYRAKTGMEYEK